MIVPALAVLALLGQTPYVRSKVDTGIKNDPKAHCLYWSGGEIRYVQGVLGNPATTGDTEFSAVNASFQTWNSVSDTCGNFHFTESPRSLRRDIGYSAAAGGENQNIILFRTTNCVDKTTSSDGCWSSGDCNNKYDCWQYAVGTIALTTTTYDRNTGQIYDADMELNAKNFTFTTVDAPPCPTQGSVSQSCVATDVQNTVTHEVGHMLGLDHAGDPNSTMFASAPLGEVKKRSLDTGSQQFVCDVYPKGQPSKDCIILQVDDDLGPPAGCDVAPGLFGALSLLLSTRLFRRRG